MRRAGFALARSRFDELWPTLEEIAEAEEEQERMEALAAAARGRVRICVFDVVWYVCVRL